MLFPMTSGWSLASTGLGKTFRDRYFVCACVYEKEKGEVESKMKGRTYNAVNCRQSGQSGEATSGDTVVGRRRLPEVRVRHTRRWPELQTSIITAVNFKIEQPLTRSPTGL